MKFQLGEKVLFLHDTGYGIVKAINSDSSLQVVDENGFERNCNLGEVCKLVAEEFSEPSVSEEFGFHSGTSKKLKSEIPEIDLHIENLSESTRGLTNHEIVQLQLKALKGFLQDIQAKKVRKALIIHGVGEGVLRQEVHYMLRAINGAILHDEHYTPRGFGATLLELRYAY